MLEPAAEVQQIVIGEALAFPTHMRCMSRQTNNVSIAMTATA